MEGLIILIGEFLVLPLVTGITALIQLIGAVVSLILELCFRIKWKPNPDAPKNNIIIPPVVIKWMRRIVVCSLSLFITTLLLINFVFLEQTVRFIADKTEAETGIGIEYDSVEGSLFSGRFAFHDLKFRQEGSGRSEFEAEIDYVETNLPIIRLILGKREIETLKVLDAQVDYRMAATAHVKRTSQEFSIGASVKVDDNRVDGLTVTTRPKLLEIPSYIIADLQMEHISVNVLDPSAVTPYSYDIEIDRLHASPLRSRFAVFDILFRTNLDATLNGSKAEITNTEENGQRNTRWATKDIPAGILASLVGGPFSLFEAGLIDVEVNDQWEVEQVDNLSLDWVIRIRDAQAILPDSVPTPLRPVTQVLINNINENPREWEFGFELTLSEGRFEGVSSLNAKQIWEGSVPVVLKQIANYSGFEEEVIKDTTSKTFDRFKKFIEERDN